MQIKGKGKKWLKILFFGVMAVGAAVLAAAIGLGYHAVGAKTPEEKEAEEEEGAVFI